MSSLPPPARPHLEYILDWGHDGVQRDLCEIADHMLDWEEKLSTHLGLADIDISDIKEENFKKPKLQRYSPSPSLSCPSPSIQLRMWYVIVLATSFQTSGIEEMARKARSSCYL